MSAASSTIKPRGPLPYRRNLKDLNLRGRRSHAPLVFTACTVARLSSAASRPAGSRYGEGRSRPSDNEHNLARHACQHLFMTFGVMGQAGRNKGLSMQDAGVYPESLTSRVMAGCPSAAAIRSRLWMLRFLLPDSMPEM